LFPGFTSRNGLGTLRKKREVKIFKQFSEKFLDCIFY
jgi:hypothetical protein